MSKILNTETTFKEGIKDLVVQAMENGGCGIQVNNAQLVLTDGTKVTFDLEIMITEVHLSEVSE